jgi:hypothetical protein
LKYVLIKNRLGTIEQLEEENRQMEQRLASFRDSMAREKLKRGYNYAQLMQIFGSKE